MHSVEYSPEYAYANSLVQAIPSSTSSSKPDHRRVQNLIRQAKQAYDQVQPERERINENIADIEAEIYGFRTNYTEPPESESRLLSRPEQFVNESDITEYPSSQYSRYPSEQPAHFVSKRHKEQRGSKNVNFDGVGAGLRDPLWRPSVTVPQDFTFMDREDKKQRANKEFMDTVRPSDDYEKVNRQAMRDNINRSSSQRKVRPQTAQEARYTPHQHLTPSSSSSKLEKPSSSHRGIELSSPTNTQSVTTSDSTASMGGQNTSIHQRRLQEYLNDVKNREEQEVNNKFKALPLGKGVKGPSWNEIAAKHDERREKNIQSRKEQLKETIKPFNFHVAGNNDDTSQNDNGKIDPKPQHTHALTQDYTPVNTKASIACQSSFKYQSHKYAPFGNSVKRLDDRSLVNHNINDQDSNKDFSATGPFKAKGIPLSSKITMLGTLHQQEKERQARMKHRSQALLEASSLPPRMSEQAHKDRLQSNVEKAQSDLFDAFHSHSSVRGRRSDCLDEDSDFTGVSRGIDFLNGKPRPHTAQTRPTRAASASRAKKNSAFDWDKDLTFKPHVNTHVPNYKEMQNNFGDKLKDMKKDFTPTSAQPFSFDGKKRPGLSAEEAEKKRLEKLAEDKQKQWENIHKVKNKIIKGKDYKPNEAAAEALQQRKEKKRQEEDERRREEEKRNQPKSKFINDIKDRLKTVIKSTHPGEGEEEEEVEEDDEGGHGTRGISIVNPNDPKPELKARKPKVNKVKTDILQRNKESARAWKEKKKAMYERVRQKPLLIELNNDEEIKLEKKKKALLMMKESLDAQGLKNYNHWFDKEEMILIGLISG